MRVVEYNSECHALSSSDDKPNPEQDQRDLLFTRRYKIYINPRSSSCNGVLPVITHTHIVVCNNFRKMLIEVNCRVGVRVGVDLNGLLMSCKGIITGRR